MANTKVGMPMVEVVTLNGDTELWAAAMAHDKAVAAIQAVLPSGCVARLSSRRIAVYRALEGFRYGEIRRIEP
jgi:hypothetical protein